ncbi:MAG TPA: efflux RND transporter periplasmic adaptor subunit [Candidatus Sulfopaludibacter sp.]|jgi:RND family efflux transporter MFP subunit|nr:efflux RND transporter periplasmic adaptor subunit [Candidatus Sulfopaludibacter sp.]
MERKAGSRPILVFFAVLAVLIATAIVAGLLPRLSRQKGLLAAAEEVSARKPVVIASPAHLAAAKDTIDLPGDLQPIVESAIFARADGFLRTRSVDIGDHVKTGQLMAEIETPELDQQIGMAHAVLAQSQSALKELEADITLSKANLNLSKATLDRWQRLSDKGVVSRQEREEKQADFAVKQAQTEKAEATLATAHDTIHGNESNLARLEQLKAFSRVTAPFDGIVTARNVDVGTLINAGNGGATREMFRVARIEPLRIFVNVPQSYVEEMHNGQSAELRVQERAGQVFPARVTNISSSLDATSRSMLVILETPNPGAALFPGMYAQVRFAGSKPRPTLRVPGDTVMMDKNGARVAVVGPDHIVHFHSVIIGQDLGSEIEVISGIADGDLVVSNPSDAVQENAHVDVRAR